MRDLEFESTDSELMLTTMLKIPEPTNHSFNDFLRDKIFVIVLIFAQGRVRLVFICTCMYVHISYL